jgi:methionyl-tRNA formyltransferase
MRVAFAGTPEFARVALDAILAAGFDVPLVLTQPDRPAGRGNKLQASPVKQLAVERGIPVHQPEKLRDPATHAPLIEARADVLVVAAYGLILPQAVLDIPRLGCVNIHGSLLPRWRGAAPIQRAIEAGDAETGITIMRMEAGLDTGPMLLTGVVPIGPQDTAATLHDRLAAMGGELVVDALRRLPDLVAKVQPEAGITYAQKIDKSEAALDWRRPAIELDRKIRALNPFPGTTGQLDDLAIKIWQARVEAGRGEPGTVLACGDDGIVVACGEGALRLTEVQKPGGRRISAADFLRGHPLAPGNRFTLTIPS